MDYVTQTAGGELILHVHIQPKATKSKIVGIYDNCLKIAIKAPPVDGKANSELLRFLASLCGLRKNQLEIKSGTASRRKQIVIHTADQASLVRCFTEQISESCRTGSYEISDR